MNHVSLVPKTLPPGDRVEVGAGRAPSGKQGMQTDGRAEGVRASIPGSGLSTTAALQHPACPAHRRNLRWDLKEGNEMALGVFRGRHSKINPGCGQLTFGLGRRELPS